MKTPEEREFDLALDLMLDDLAAELVGKGGSFVGPPKPPHGKLGPSAGLATHGRGGVNLPASAQRNPLHMTGPPGHTEWVEEEHPRGKTTEESNSGSFAPKGGGERERTPLGQRNLPFRPGEARGGKTRYIRFKPDFPLEEGAPVRSSAVVFEEAPKIRSILKGSVEKLEELGGGVGRTFKGVIGGVKVAVKTNDAPEIYSNIPGGNETGREVAAYLVNLALNRLVDAPEAVQTDKFSSYDAPSVGYRYNSGPLGRIAAIVWRAGETFGAASALREAERNAAGLFDAIIGNRDRHGGNGNIDKDGHFISLDHSLTFPGTKAMSGHNKLMYARPAELTGKELALLAQFEERKTSVDKALKPYLRDVEIDMMWHRVRTMRNTRRIYGRSGDARADAGASDD